MSQCDEMIEQQLSLCQQFSVNAIVEQLAIEEKLSAAEISKAFDAIYFCLVTPKYFAEYGREFRKKFLAVQYFIRCDGLRRLQSLIREDFFGRVNDEEECATGWAVSIN